MATVTKSSLNVVGGQVSTATATAGNGATITFTTTSSQYAMIAGYFSNDAGVASGSLSVGAFVVVPTVPNNAGAVMFAGGLMAPPSTTVTFQVIDSGSFSFTIRLIYTLFGNT